MLSVEALNQITALSIAATGSSVHTATPAVMVPEQFRIESLERFEENRARFRGVLVTNSVDDFCQYVTQQQALQLDYPVLGYIDAQAMACTTFFNLGDHHTPGHADHKATLTLKPTAAYQALQQIAGKQLSQQQLAEWMEDWHDQLTVSTSQGENITVAAAVQKVRTITIKASAERTSSESNFGKQSSAMDSIEAAHADQQPDVIMFRFRPFEDLQERQFTLRMSIITGGDKPVLKLRWVQEEAVKEWIAQEFKERLKADLNGIATLTLGTFNPGT